MVSELVSRLGVHARIMACRLKDSKISEVKKTIYIFLPNILY